MATRGDYGAASRRNLSPGPLAARAQIGEGAAMDLRERHSHDDARLVRHPWERARARVVSDLVGRVVRGDAPAGVVRVVDVGAGDAYVAAQLLARFAELSITCVDAHYDDADLARLQAPQLRAVRSLNDAGAARFRGALLLDVLEHVDDDRALLNDVLAHVDDDGWALITVPAWPQLFSDHDRALGHHRRYTPRALRRLIDDAGLVVVESGTVFQSLAPVRALARLWPARRGAHEDAEIAAWQGGAVVTAVVSAALSVDAAVARAASRAHLPTVGLSAYALCRRRR